MSTALLTMDPQCFGPAGAQRIAIYHPPRGQTRDRAVLLCYPSGHEYVRCHAAVRRLADQLARAGFPVLRFDYLGTGDSAGELDEVTLADWRSDVSLAAAHLREQSGLDTIDVAGLRLGANLALWAIASLPELGRLVLWQPVADGRRFVQEMGDLHAAYLESFGAQPAPPDDEGAVEMLGFRYSKRMLDDLEDIDLARVAPPSAAHILLVDNTADRAHESLASRLGGSGAAVRYEHLPDPAIWLAEPYQQVVPRESIRVITAWLSEVSP